MNELMQTSLPTRDYQVERPIVDFLCHEPALAAIVAEFIPGPAVSNNRKESVYIRDGTDSARRVRELLVELGVVCKLAAPISKVAHAGGDSFSIYTGPDLIELSNDTALPAQRMDAYVILQTLAQEIEFEFVRQRRTGERQAG
jgi:hypothetical protein